jgi:hypothetical protein
MYTYRDDFIARQSLGAPPSDLSATITASASVAAASASAKGGAPAKGGRAAVMSKNVSYAAEQYPMGYEKPVVGKEEFMRLILKDIIDTNNLFK